MKGIYIIIGIVVLGLIALMLFSNKSKGNSNDTAANNSGTADVPLFGADFGKNFGVLRSNTETWDNWFARRQAQGWTF